MDGLDTAKLLGSGSAQVILAVMLVAVAGICWKLASALIESFKDRISENKDMLKQSSGDTRLVTDALKDMKASVDLALAALKGRP